MFVGGKFANLAKTSYFCSECMNNKIVTFGELLLRFSKSNRYRLTQGQTFSGAYGGSEAYVAVSLAMMGDDVEYVTRLPQNQIGQAASMKLLEYGVQMPNTLWGGNRMGTYYYEESAGMRSSKVVYDRANSAFFDLKPGMFNWREILKDADVFHASGITGAISKDSCEATFEALNIADEMGKTISFDINHRKNLWKYGADPRETLSRMLEYADVVFGDIIEYEFIMERQVPFLATDSNYEMPLDFYEEWFDEIHSRFPRCNKWLMGMRNMMSSNHNTLTALLWSDGKLYHTRIDDIHDIVDAMGVGDAFTAGQLHALRAFPGDNQRVLDFALAAATLKYSIPGDANLCTEEEILEFLETIV